MDRNIEEIVTSNHEVKIMDRRQIYLKRIKKIISKISSLFIIILLTLSLYNFINIKILKWMKMN